MISTMKDRDATRAAKFKDRRSKILNNGRRHLFGKDMEELRLQTFERDNWRCTECGSGEWIHMHHIVPRGERGVDRDDHLRNTTTLCVTHHAMKHPRVKFQKVPA